MSMAAEQIIFNPDRDLLLRLTYTVQKGKAVDTATGPSVSPESGAALVFMTFAHFMEAKSVHEDDEEDIIKEVGMLVSAKHLMLASPVFKAMFKHSFLEGETLRSTGKVEVSTR